MCNLFVRSLEAFEFLIEKIKKKHIKHHITKEHFYHLKISPYMWFLRKNIKECSSIISLASDIAIPIQFKIKQTTKERNI